MPACQGWPLLCLCAWEQTSREKGSASLDPLCWALAMPRISTQVHPLLQVQKVSLTTKVSPPKASRRSRDPPSCERGREPEREKGKQKQNRSSSAQVPLRWDSWWTKQPPQRLRARVKWGEPPAPGAPGTQPAVLPTTTTELLHPSRFLKPLTAQGAGGQTGSDDGTSLRPEDMTPPTCPLLSSLLLCPTLFTGKRMRGAPAGPRVGMGVLLRPR